MPIFENGGILRFFVETPENEPFTDPKAWDFFPTIGPSHQDCGYWPAIRGQTDPPRLGKSAMALDRISRAHFRNHRARELAQTRQFNLPLGENGARKTNILEAIHLLAQGPGGQDRQRIG